MGNRLHIARKRQGLTQEEVAAKIGCSRVHISDLERGERSASLPIAIALVNALALDDTAAMSLLRELAAEPTDTTATNPPPPAQEAA